MDQPTSSPLIRADQREAFTVLVLRYLDGACPADEIRQLKDAILGSPAHRDLFVQVCRLQGNLYEAFAPQRAEMQSKQAAVGAALASASVGQGDAAAPTAGFRASSDGTIPRPDAQATGDFPGAQESSADVPTADPGAETLIGELSGEDTIHPAPKAPES